MILTTTDGRRYGLQVGDNVIGRSGDCTVRLESPRTSRHHARIQWDGQQARIMDLGSTNGTLVNGLRLEPNRYYQIGLGDQVDFGGGPCAIAAGSASGAYEAGAYGAGVPGAIPTGAAAPLAGSSPSPVPLPAAQPPRSRPSWLVIAALGVLLIVVFGLAVWWGLSHNAATQEAGMAAPPAGPPAAGEPAAVTAPAAADAAGSAAEAVADATATLAPARTTVRASAAADAAGKSGTLPGGTLPGGAAAGQSAMGASSSGVTASGTAAPGMLQQFPGGVDPALLAALLGGTPLPGMLAATPAPSAGTGEPAAAEPAPAAAAGAKRYAAPKLRGPASGSSYQGEDAVVMLEWEPTRGLAAGDYYWVMVLYKQGERDQVGGVWTKDTSYRVPGWLLAQAPGRFDWQVVIAQATGLADQGGKLLGTASEPSERRWFGWQPGEPEPAPSGGNNPEPSPTYGG